MEGFEIDMCFLCEEEAWVSAVAVWMNGSVPQILDHPVSLRLLERRYHQYLNHFKGIWKGLRLTCVIT
jgi:hypothetical protein